MEDSQNISEDPNVAEFDNDVDEGSEGDRETVDSDEGCDKKLAERATGRYTISIEVHDEDEEGTYVTMATAAVTISTLTVPTTWKTTARML